MSHHSRQFFASTLLAICAAQAQAVGKLAELSVVDRSNGATLPVYFHAGQYWVAGKPGAKYAISLCNKLGERLLAVTSVDGLNVLTGARAGWGQTGYVFGSRTCYEITGWRKSDHEVATFEFSAAGDSYAAVTGRPKELGVIGVALFRERRPAPVIAPPVYQRRSEADIFRAPGANSHLPAPAPAPAPAPESSRNSGGSATKSTERGTSADSALSTTAPMPIEKLGTAHGQREESLVSHTEFERAQLRPNEIIQIRYESYEALVVLGVIPNTSRRVPNPFPISGRDSYVPDPPPRPD